MNAPGGGPGASGETTARSLTPDDTRPVGRKARGILAELGAWLAASVEQRQLWAHCHRVGADTAQHYRNTVLAHPDLAERVRDLYRLGKAETWGGYLPPAQDATGAPNRSPYRAALLDIIGEAKRREAGGRS